MKATIYKYKIGNQEQQNYFDRTSSLEFYDKFIVERFLKNSLPIFREEWSSEDDVNQLKTGYFDFTTSLLLSEKSVLNKNIYEFFESMSSRLSEYKFIIVIETGNPDRSYSGIVDLNAIKANITQSGNQYNITLPVIGLESEIVDLLKKTFITKLLQDLIFETEYLPVLLYWIDPAKVEIEPLLDLETKLLGTVIKVEASTYNTIWNAHLDPTGTFCVITNWDTFKSFLLGYSMRMKLCYVGSNDEGPLFKLKIFFRSDGIGIATLGKFKSENQKLSVSGSQSLAIFFTKRTDAEHSELIHYTGVIMNRDNIYITGSQDIIYHQNEGYYDFGGIIFYDDLQVINLSLWDGLQAGDSALSRCIVNPNNWHTLIQYVANYELNYYLKATKQVKLVKHVTEEDSFVQVGCIADINGKDFSCERINSYNPVMKETESEWVEV